MNFTETITDIETVKTVIFKEAEYCWECCSDPFYTREEHAEYSQRFDVLHDLMERLGWMGEFLGVEE